MSESGITYKGRPIEELTHDELLVVFVQMVHSDRRQMEERQRQFRIMQELRERGR